MSETGYLCIGFGLGLLLGVIWCGSCWIAGRKARDKEWISTGKKDEPLLVNGCHYCAFEVTLEPPEVELADQEIYGYGKWDGDGDADIYGPHQKDTDLDGTHL